MAEFDYLAFNQYLIIENFMIDQARENNWRLL